MAVEPLPLDEVPRTLDEAPPPRLLGLWDQIGFAFIPDETPAEDPPSEQDDECRTVALAPALSPLTRGDFTVRDVP